MPDPRETKPQPQPTEIKLPDYDVALPPGFDISAPVPTQFGKGQITRFLGEGRMGAVFVVSVHGETNQEFALKVMKANMDSDGQLRFGSEVLNIGAIQSQIEAFASTTGFKVGRPVKHFPVSQDLPFEGFLTELVQPQWRLEKKENQEQLSDRDKVEIILQTFNFFHTLHNRANLVYSDQKRENYWWDGENCQLIFTDFNVVDQINLQTQDPKEMSRYIGQIKKDYYRAMDSLVFFITGEVMSSRELYSAQGQANALESLASADVLPELIEFFRERFAQLDQPDFIRFNNNNINGQINEIIGYYDKDPVRLMIEIDDVLSALSDLSSGQLARKKPLITHVQSMLIALRGRMQAGSDQDIMDRLDATWAHFFQLFPEYYLDDSLSQTPSKTKRATAVFASPERASEIQALHDQLEALAANSEFGRLVASKNWAGASEALGHIQASSGQVLIASFSDLKLARDPAVWIAYQRAKGGDINHFAASAASRVELLELTVSEPQGSVTERLSYYRRLKQLLVILDDAEKRMMAICRPKLSNVDTIDFYISSLEKEAARQSNMARSLAKIAEYQAQAKLLASLANGNYRWKLHSDFREPFIVPSCPIADQLDTQSLVEKAKASYASRDNILDVLLFRSKSGGVVWRDHLSGKDRIQQQQLVLRLMDDSISWCCLQHDRQPIRDRLHTWKELEYWARNTDIHPLINRINNQFGLYLDILDQIHEFETKKAQASLAEGQQGYALGLELVSWFGENLLPKLQALGSDELGAKLTTALYVFYPDHEDYAHVCLTARADMRLIADRIRSGEISGDDVLAFEERARSNYEDIYDRVGQIDSHSVLSFHVYRLVAEYLHLGNKSKLNSLKYFDSFESRSNSNVPRQQLLPRFEIKVRGGAPVAVAEINGSYTDWLREQLLVESAIQACQGMDPNALDFDSAVNSLLQIIESSIRETDIDKLFERFNFEKAKISDLPAAVRLSAAGIVHRVNTSHGQLDGSNQPVIEPVKAEFAIPDSWKEKLSLVEELFLALMATSKLEPSDKVALQNYLALCEAIHADIEARAGEFLLTNYGARIPDEVEDEDLIDDARDELDSFTNALTQPIQHIFDLEKILRN